MPENECWECGTSDFRAEVCSEHSMTRENPPYGDSVRYASKMLIAHWPQEAIDTAVHKMPGAPIANRNVLASAVRGLLDAGYVVVPSTDYRGAVSEILLLRRWIDRDARDCPSNTSVDEFLALSMARYPDPGGQ